MDIDYIMSTIADKLQDLVTAKEDMKTALIEKGVTPTGGLSTYATAVAKIPKVIMIKANDGMTFGYSNTTMSSTGTEMDTITTLNVDMNGVTTSSAMFRNAAVSTINLYDMDGVIDTSKMFMTCTKLTSINGLKTQSVVNMTDMFYNCPKLTVPILDCGNVEILEGSWSAVNVMGLKDLGKKPNLVIGKYTLGGLSRDSIYNIIDTFYDRKSAGYSVIQIYIKEDIYQTLSSTYINKAKEKGWEILQY